jgi:hypothetical protein
LIDVLQAAASASCARRSADPTRSDEQGRIVEVGYRFSGLVQSSLCTSVHRLESTVRYLGIEVDDALEIAEQTEV